MKKVILLCMLGLVAAASSGCSHTAKGVEKDAHKDVEWVGHRF